MAGSVTLIQLPAELNDEGQRTLVRKLHQATDIDRPRIVLDCSNLSEYNVRAIRLLLLTLEEAMKRNGDARLAGVAPQGMSFLQSTGVTRLFRIFNSTTEAVNSFHRPHISQMAFESGHHTTV